MEVKKRQEGRVYRDWFHSKGVNSGPRFRDFAGANSEKGDLCDLQVTDHRKKCFLECDKIVDTHVAHSNVRILQKKVAYGFEKNKISVWDNLFIHSTR